MDVPGARHRLLDAARNVEAEVARHVRILGSGHDDAPDVAEALQRVGGQDPVDRMEGVAAAVGLDVVGVSGELLAEARGDLVAVIS